MKSFEELTNLNKADLLYSLFPAEMEQFVQFIIKRYTKVKPKCPDSFINQEAWPVLMEELYNYMAVYKSKLWTSQRLFKDKLFYHLMAYATIHFLWLYIKPPRNTVNEKFVLLARFLFF
ncbi:hypothetical protein DXN04_14115 [Chitinophaga silvisoli]|uniref:Uncharacterized protein n=1 Tax=Chitinophaga silvisoli TaxID=2291814 RepID=A0A3E1P2I4_9BACT|nr:hypothetical protein DXN04_14115 [Chitinophaga silvisoli]